MGFYLRKSVSVGPLRFNLSKSGIGVSAGVRGLRFGSGPRGNYVHMGRHGLYYRATLPTSRLTSPPIPSQPTPALPSDLAPVESGDVSAMADSSSASLLAELNAKQKKWRTWPWICAAFLLFSGPALSALSAAESTRNTVAAVVYLVAALAAVLVAHRFDTLRRTTVLLYNLEDDVEKHYRAFHNAFDTVAKCGGRWHVNARSQVTNAKYSSGATQNYQRTAVTLHNQMPPNVVTNIDVPTFPAGPNTLYFFPDRLLVFGASSVGAVNYERLKLEVSTSRFVESGVVPSDATVVGSQWQYANRDGGPDRRFKNNRQFPIALYEELRFTSATGLNELFQASKVGVGQPLADAITQLKTTSAILSKNEVAPATGSPIPTTVQPITDTHRRTQYEKEPDGVRRGGPTVSGGLPSLGKRR